ncbi:retrotransposon protein [Striga asiatica]|uniref:Retrotransposon protein n=1 Tax=Striga asiatica TaxID=4170 RepID=A0A5A7RCA2_STRAF|nr:retrotransposon protein [Striga asiatica]
MVEESKMELIVQTPNNTLSSIPEGETIGEQDLLLIENTQMDFMPELLPQELVQYHSIREMQKPNDQTKKWTRLEKKSNRPNRGIVIKEVDSSQNSLKRFREEDDKMNLSNPTSPEADRDKKKKKLFSEEQHVKAAGKDKGPEELAEFQNFIARIGMCKVSMQGHQFTWCNNRRGKDFIEERLDRVFASYDWIFQYKNALVLNCLKTASDHSLLVLSDDGLNIPKRRPRFQFDCRWIEKEGILEVVQDS